MHMYLAEQTCIQKHMSKDAVASILFVIKLKVIKGTTVFLLLKGLSISFKLAERSGKKW